MEDVWWDKLATETQDAADKNDTKTVYNLLRKAFGPRKAMLTPLRSKDGTSVVSKASEIACRWREHFSDLLNQPSVVDDEVIDSIEQKPIIEHLSNLPTHEEVVASIKKLNLGKAPGSDGLFAELFVHGGQHLHNLLFTFLCKLWQEESVPEDWVNAILVALYKGKGTRDMCGNYRGIALLVTAGKILAGILLKRLNTHVAKNILPESQCGFRAQRGTADMIFTAKQMQEKCREQQMDLYHCFIDLKKAFDTVHRKSLWKILRKIGCPDKFVTMIERLHDGMKARANINGELTDAIPVENGVKQGDILGPTLFSIYFAIVFLVAFEDCEHGVYIRYRTTGKLFNLRRFNAKSKVLLTLIRDLLYADDCDLVTHTERDLQYVMDCLSTSCKSFGLTISIDKTKVMYQPAPGKVRVDPSILVEGKHLEVVQKFVYLGSTLNDSCSLDDEIITRVQKGTIAFRGLETRCWKKRSISLSTKLKVYSACVLPSLLYACETWVPYKQHIKTLERFHQRCLRRILNVHWSSHLPDTEILHRAGLRSIESLLILHRLRWVGTLVRMSDHRLPKQALYGELAVGKRPPHKPRTRFKDCIRNDLKCCEIDLDTWEDQCLDANGWRNSMKKSVAAFEVKRVDHEKVKRAVRKRENVLLQVTNLVCDVCSRICLSKAGLKSHSRTHQTQPVIVYDINPLNCMSCNKVCKSKSGLKRHMQIHNVEDELATPATGIQNLMCSECGKACRSLAGLKSHIRAHAR